MPRYKSINRIIAKLRQHYAHLGWLPPMLGLEDRVSDTPLPSLRWAYVRRLEQLSAVERRDELEELRIALRIINVDIDRWVEG